MNANDNAEAGGESSPLAQAMEHALVGRRYVDEASSQPDRAGGFLKLAAEHFAQASALANAEHHRLRVADIRRQHGLPD